MYAPIILFAYNRPWHTEQTLESLMLNELAAESILYVFCDGAKVNATNEQKENVNSVREVVSRKLWCKEVFIVESEHNKGLANSIIDGVSQIIEKYGKVIVLEDDLVTSPCFLDYMNNTLNFYQNYASVFSISADNPGGNKILIPADYSFDVFVSLRNFSYGWGTWSDRWNKVDWELKNIDTFFKNDNLICAFNRGGDDLSKMLKMQLSGEIDSWSVRFSFSHFIHHAVSIMPCKTYIDNLGMDGSGTHCSDLITKSNTTELSLIKRPNCTPFIYEDKRIINAFYSAYYPKKRPLWQKIINRISRMLGGENVFVIKKKVYC